MKSLAIQYIGDGYPLILFHGWGFDSEIWKPWLPELSRSLPHHQIILIDLPGFGDSPFLEWEAFKTQVFAELPRPFAIIGWSLGGLYATRLAIEHPESVSHVINLASSPYFMHDNNWAGIKEHVLDEFYERFQMFPEETQRQFVHSQIANPLLIPLIQNKNSMMGLKKGLEMLKQWDLRLSITSLNMPVAFVFGRLDTIVPRTLMPMMKKIYPKFHYTLLPHAAHIPFLSHPESSAELLRNLLC